MGLPLIAAGVGAISSLLGGRRASKDAKRAMAFQAAQIAAQNEYNKPINIRARAEEGGFNPLLFAGPGVGLQTGVAEYVPSGMGNAIANAGLALASGISEQATLNAYNSKLAEQNAELRKALETATLRPEVPGIYGTSQSVRLPAAPAVDTSLVSGGKTATIVPVKGPGGGAPENPNRYPSEVDVSDKVEEPTPLWTGYEVGGEVIYMPEGPDADELASGLALDALMGERRRKRRDDWFTREFWKFDPNHRDGYHRTGPYNAN